MNTDIALFFAGKPKEFALYLQLEGELLRRWPETEIRAKKTQISLSAGYLFAAVSHPRNRKAGLLVTFGLNRREDSPRISQSVEPYPGRWTHHVLVEGEEELDEELFAWLTEAREFAQSKAQKRGKRK